MNILKISKYPPIEGGESSKAYWISQELCKRGVNIYILTNAFEVEDIYRCELTGNEMSYYSPKGIKIFNTSPFNIPNFIPFYNPYDLKLISKGIEILQKYKIDIIEGSYLLPYGFVASYLANLFKKPLIISHAGSDITRLFNSSHFSNVLRHVIESANKIITFNTGQELFRRLNISPDKIIETKSYIDTDTFIPKKQIRMSELLGREIQGVVLSHFGKLERGKGLFKLIDNLSKIKNDYTLILFGNGKDYNAIKQRIDYYKLSDKIIFHEFLPPWKMPLFISASDCLLSVEHKFGVNIHGPILPRESMSCGVPVLVSKEIGFYSNLSEYHDGIFKVNPDDDKEYFGKLHEIISNENNLLDTIGKNGRKWIEKNIDKNQVIDNRIEVYEKLLN